jgi:hypothetical protein
VAASGATFSSQSTARQRAKGATRGRDVSHGQARPCYQAMGCLFARLGLDDPFGCVPRFLWAAGGQPQLARSHGRGHQSPPQPAPCLLGPIVIRNVGVGLAAPQGQRGGIGVERVGWCPCPLGSFGFVKRPLDRP